MDRHAVLVFHDQPLTDEQQIAFTRSLGKIELNTANNVTRLDQRRLSIEMSDISNLDQHSNMLARDDRRRAFNLGNRLWHSDSSFKAVSAKYSLLSARIIPSASQCRVTPERNLSRIASRAAWRVGDLLFAQ
jgi:alpha-ketoglutarate-dependent 2,4-dichlorophenoxyacetate dioxygenase